MYLRSQHALPIHIFDIPDSKVHVISLLIRSFQRIHPVLCFFDGFLPRQCLKSSVIWDITPDSALKVMFLQNIKLTFNRLHCVMSQKIEFFISTEPQMLKGIVLLQEVLKFLPNPEIKRSTNQCHLFTLHIPNTCCYPHIWRTFPFATEDTPSCIDKELIQYGNSSPNKSTYCSTLSTWRSEVMFSYNTVRIIWWWN
jgi:hypothetical protein